jgi:tRNA threonylcarbamoyladenosine dehydratase
MPKALKPLILKEGRYKKSQVSAFKRKASKVKDIYLDQLKELFEVKNPRLIFGLEFKRKFSEFKKIKNKEGLELSGNWIYYPWNKTLLHTLTEKENNLLRTNRNKNIITAKEQEKLSDFTIVIAGLSVGGNITTTLLHNGFPKNLKLADFDTLDTTNLNRVRAKLSDVEESKIDIVSKQLYELDPYVNLKLFPKGLSEKNIKSFVSGKPKPKLIFEIIDDFEIKILLRKEARKRRVPVVMLTSLGDNVLIDIERYDINPKTKLFNGKVSEKILNDILAGNINEKDKHKYAVAIVESKNLPPRLRKSIKEIGKTLVGRPQLMSTVTVASGIAALIARKIALGGKVSNRRTLIELNGIIKNDR